MRFDILSIFPEMFESPFGASILHRARERKLVEIHQHDIRDFATDKHRKVDDIPYGGGAGMVMKAPPVVAAIESVSRLKKSCRLLMSPRGSLFNQAKAAELAQMDQLIILCGRYEGVDERVLSVIDDELSIGDYVLSGGEIPAMVVVDAVMRLIPGVLGNSSSTQDESHREGWLEYPHYTRPVEFRGMKVPEILLSGHHAEIEAWRRAESQKITIARRPDLVKKTI